MRNLLNMRRVVPLLVTLCLLALFTFAQDVRQEIEKNRVLVAALDRNGHVLRTGLGFIWDKDTIVCSSSNIKGSSMITVQASGMKSQTHRLISYSSLFDLAVFKAQEEMPETVPLGSSRMLTPGDTVYFFLRRSGKWQLQEGTVKGWSDSGRGYETIRLQIPAEQQVSINFAPTPLFNKSGKVVGWLHQDSVALPLDVIDSLISDKTASVSLSEIPQSSKNFWALKKMKPEVLSPEELELPEVAPVSGTPRFPFQVHLPKYWQYEKMALTDRFLLRTFDEQLGMCVDLRIGPQEDDDLMMAIQKAETLISPGMRRSEMAPYSADHFTGFKGCYEDPNPEADTAICIFYAMSSKNFYILSIAYPRKFGEEIKPFIEEIVSSLQF